MELAAERGWDQVSLKDISDRAALPFRDVFRLAPTKLAVLSLFEAAMNEALLDSVSEEVAAGENEEEVSVRDRLFDVMLERLELMAPYKTALNSILPGMLRDPVSLFGLHAPMRDLTRLFLSASGLDADGLKGLLRDRGLALIWIRTLGDWLKDEDPGLSATMAKLDHRLRRAERIAERFDRA